VTVFLSFVFLKETDVNEQRQKVWRSPAEAAMAMRIGFLRGGGLGLLMTAPVAALAWLFGEWLDRGGPKAGEGWLLGVVVLFVGGFFGMMILGQRAAMSHWPARCRLILWGHWCRWGGLAVGLGLLVATYVILRAWVATHCWSLALGVGLEVVWLFSCFGLALGGFLGERRVRRYLEEAGFDRVGWFNYAERASTTDPAQTALTDAPAERTGVQPAQDGTQSAPTDDRPTP
jgi:hypothetical protein